LNLNIPNGMVANRDGTPLISRPGLWLAIKNRTTIPFSLCTAGSTFSSSSPAALGSGIGGGTSEGCRPFWIVLPGETYFYAVTYQFPNEPDTRLNVSVILEGKPLAADGGMKTWILKWTGTVKEATAVGENMKANVR